MFKKKDTERQIILATEIKKLQYLTIDCDLKRFTKNPAMISALFVDSLSPDQVLQMALRNEVSHIVQNSFESLEDKADLMKRLDLDYMNFYSSNFKILKKPDEVQLFVFLRDELKQVIIDKVCFFLKINQQQARHFNLISVLSEMIMNAQAVAESHKEVSAKNMIKILVEKNKDVVAFSVFDYVGALSFDKFLKKIEAAQELGFRKALNLGRGGAGLGTSIIYNNSESLFLSCRPNVVTRVSAVIPFNKNTNDLQMMQKSVHIIRNLAKVKGNVYV